MSDNENLPPAPSKQTSSVPLKKETVRVTLKAADAPPAVPSATVPMAPPVRPPIPGGPPKATVPGGAPRPPAPAPTIPLRTAGGTPTATVPGGAPRPPAPAPTIPLRTAGGPPTMAPAPTIRLAPTSAAPTLPGGAPVARTAPSLPGATGTPTMVLPKATVQLQPPTRPLGTSFPASQVGTVAAVEDDDEDVDSKQGLINIISIVGFIAALVVLGFQLMNANTWINAEDNARKGEWSQLMEAGSNS